MFKTGNLFEHLPQSGAGEIFEPLCVAAGGRIERIVSYGAATPPGEWYDQSDVEFVVLLSGSATVRFEQNEQVIALRPGSYLEIAAHERHRVDSTDSDQPTIWLAIHLRSEAR